MAKNLRKTDINTLMDLDNWTHTHTKLAFNTLITVIENSAKEVFGVKYKRPGAAKPNFEEDGDILKMNKHITKLTRAILCHKQAIKHKYIPKAITKLTKLPFSNINNLVNMLEPLNPTTKNR